MSFKVLVVPEDHTNNGAILKPLVQALMALAGRPNAAVKVLDNPRVQGFDAARRAIVGELVDKYHWMDLWLFIPDADRQSAAAAAALEAELVQRGIALLCSPAQPEVEIYAVAAYAAEIPGGWQAARSHPSFKEVIFPPLLARHGDARRPQGGRDLMIAASLRNLPRLFQLCPELSVLRDRIAQRVAETP